MPTARVLVVHEAYTKGFHDRNSRGLLLRVGEMISTVQFELHPILEFVVPSKNGNTIETIRVHRDFCLDLPRDRFQEPESESESEPDPYPDPEPIHFHAKSQEIVAISPQRDYIARDRRVQETGNQLQEPPQTTLLGIRECSRSNIGLQTRRA